MVTKEERKSKIDIKGIMGKDIEAYTTENLKWGTEENFGGYDG